MSSVSSASQLAPSLLPTGDPHKEGFAEVINIVTGHEVINKPVVRSIMILVTAL